MRDLSANIAGRRALVADAGRTLPAEAGRLLHITAAATEESRQVRRRAKQQQQRHHQGGGGNSSPSAAEGTRRSRKSKAGGSVWLVMKGDWHSSHIPSLPVATAAAHPKHRNLPETRARLRVTGTLRQWMEALDMAEGYVASAWREAQSGGLLYEGADSPTPDGEAYLKEQYEVAWGMLPTNPMGSVLLQMMNLQHGVENPTPQQPAGAATASVPPAFLAEMMKDACSVVQRRHALRVVPQHRPSSTAVPSSLSPSEAAAEATALIQESFFIITSPHGSEDGIGPQGRRMVFVRLRNSHNTKASGVLQTRKSGSQFVGNLMRVIRKELLASSLPRGSGHPQQQQQQQQQESGAGNHHPPHSSNTNSSGGKAKKKGAGGRRR